MDFTKKVVLITGGAQGIGKGIAQYFVTRHAHVVIVDNDQKAGKETEAEYKALGSIQFIHTDVSSQTQVNNAIKKTIKTFKRLDYVVNNSGVFTAKPINDLSLKEWHRILDINLTSVFLFSKLAVPYLSKTKGAIVNIASTRALMSEPNTEAYAASKGGIVALTHALAISLGPKIRVNCISPGWIETRDWKRADKRITVKHSKTDLNQHPAGRVGSPEDIATLVGYLLSHEAKFITGANFVVDGGMTRKMIYV